MKYHLSITKREILTVIIFIMGLIFLCKGINSYFKYEHALILENLEEGKLKKGRYVTGNIDSYIGQIMYGSGKFYGVSQGYITFGKTYEFYTIPVAHNSYIELMISDESVTESLDAFENGHGEGVYFEGVIVEPPVEPNYAWYSKVENFNTDDLITSYVVKEANLKRKNTAYIGVLLLVLAALLFFDAGGLKNIVSEDIEHTGPVANVYAKVYSKDNELLAEKKQLEMLERRLKSAKRNAILCLLLLLIGIYIVYSAYLLEGKLFGVLLLLISVRGIWRYFINSSSTLAKSLVRRFTLKSISLQIEEHRQNIEKLEEKG